MAWSEGATVAAGAGIWRRARRLRSAQSREEWTLRAGGQLPYRCTDPMPAAGGPLRAHADEGRGGPAGRLVPLSATNESSGRTGPSAISCLPARWSRRARPRQGGPAGRPSRPSLREALLGPAGSAVIDPSGSYRALPPPPSLPSGCPLKARSASVRAGPRRSVGPGPPRPEGLQGLRLPGCFLSGPPAPGTE